MSQQTGRIPSLDGWRGIAILLVLVCHISVNLKPSLPWWWYRLGSYGVQLFFVLSGFLITSRLAQGRIDLKQFYIRRFFRLTPAVWTYLACMSLVAIAMRSEFRSGLLGCVFFYRNYLGVGSSFMDRATGHLWSLSVEEQFYLVWPVLLLVLRGRAIWGAVLGYCADAAFLLLHGRYSGWTYLRTEAHIHALLAGCILALVWPREGVRVFLSRHSGWLLPLSVIGWASGVIFSFPFEPLQSFLIAVMLAASMEGSDVLCFRPLMFTGRISYSVYVWQNFCLAFGWIGIAMIPVVGYLSYYFIERPCIRLGARIATPRGEPEGQIHQLVT